jgi:hypothetical protein
MARLLASPGFRDEVLRDGGAALAGYDLTDPERAELLQLLRDRLGTYAACVAAGKLDFFLVNLPPAVISHLPQEGLRASLERYIDEHPDRSFHPRDAGLAFMLRWMEEDLPQWENAPAHAADVIRFERLRREILAAPPRYPRTPAPPDVPIVRHPGWNAERFAHDVAAGAPRSAPVSWSFKREGNEELIRPCHPVLVDIAHLTDSPARAAEVAEQIARLYDGDPHLGPDVLTAASEVLAELQAEGSLVPG